MAEFSLQALHDEIEADPENLEYKDGGGNWIGDQAICPHPAPWLLSLPTPPTPTESASCSIRPHPAVRLFLRCRDTIRVAKKEKLTWL